MKSLHPTCRVISGVEVQTGQMRARVSTFVLGTACSRFYDFGRNKMEILKIMTNTPMNLGTAERERSMHSPAVRAVVSEIAAFRLTSRICERP